MGMTLTQKILAGHSGVSCVKTGDTVVFKPDLIIGHDASSPLAISKLKQIGNPRLAGADRTVLIPDHFMPPATAEHAAVIRQVLEFGKANKVKYIVPLSEIGVEHALLPEMGLVRAGDCIIGGDSHTCTAGALGAFAMGVGSTDLAAAMALGELWLSIPPGLALTYTGNRQEWVTGKDFALRALDLLGTSAALGCSIEYRGDALAAMNIEERMSMANMSTEMGAVSGIFPPDDLTMVWLQEHGSGGNRMASDPDAVFEQEITIDVSQFGPLAAKPHNPGNVAPVEELADVALDQIFIGSCTNGRLSDLQLAAKVLKGRKIAPGLRMYVSPATRRVQKEAEQQGLLQIFMDAGAILLPNACTVCFGHIGALAKGERCLSTSNRNFRGRMGHPEAEIYLSNPAVAAASAITGKITHPACL